MKKEELVNIIRGVVREEVHRELPNVLVEILASKVSDREVVRESERAPIHRTSRTSQPQRKFSTNPILNQVLNETCGGVPPDEGVEMVSAELPVPGAQVSILDKIKTISKEQLKEHKEVASVLNVLNRDFRQVVKAVDRKASNIAPPPDFKMTPGMFGDDKG